MYNSWEDVKEKDTNEYIACTPSEEAFKSSGLIDSGLLLNTIRRHMGYDFLKRDILEYGCGNGRMAQFLREYFNRYIAADISKTMLKMIMKKLDVEGLKTSGEDIPLEDESVDIIFTFTVLMHNKKNFVPKIVNEFRRVLKRGGHLFMQLPCYTDKNDRDRFNDVSIWTKEEIIEMMVGWETLHIADSGRPLGSQISPQHFEYHVFRRVV